jgi:hypothetical protein
MQNNYHNNKVHIIRDMYKIGDLWFFDEPFLGLKQELFVSSASAVLDKVIGKTSIENKETPSVIFGEVLPEYDAEFILVEDMGHSANYSYNGEVFWLCGALFYWFKGAPKSFKIKFLD